MHTQHYSIVMGDPTDGWGELLDSLPATSSFVAPGQEDFFLYSQLREAGSGAQSASRSAAYPGSSPQQLGSTWPAATHPSHGHSTYVVQPAGGSPLPSHDRPPTHSNHGSPYQYYPQQPHQLTDQQLAQLKALDLASAGNSPGPPGPQAHDSPTRPSHQYTANPNYNPHGGYAPYTQAHDPHLPALAGAPAAPPPYGAMGPTDHQVYPHPFPAQAHQPPVQEQVQQPYPAYMQYSTRPSVPYPSQAPQGAHPSTAGPLAPSASPPGPQYASPPAPSAVPPLALPPQPATGPSVGSPAGGIRPPTSGSPHAAQAGARPYSLSPMAAGGEAFYGNGPVRHVVDDFRTSPLPGSLGEQTPDRMGTGGPGSASRFGYEAAGGAGLLEGRGTGGSGTGGSGGGGGARASASPSMQRYQVRRLKSCVSAQCMYVKHSGDLGCCGHSGGVCKAVCGCTGLRSTSEDPFRGAFGLACMSRPQFQASQPAKHAHLLRSAQPRIATLPAHCCHPSHARRRRHTATPPPPRYPALHLCRYHTA